MLSESGYKNEAFKKLQLLYSELKNNNEYLHELGDAYIYRHDYEEAIIIFQQESRLESSIYIYRQLGLCYSQLNDFKNAENALITAVNMVPNRFTERYLLYQFYLKSHQLAKAQLTKNAILALPIKIKSSQIEFIKEKLKINNINR